MKYFLKEHAYSHENIYSQEISPIFSLKVSKPQKQILVSPHTPKNQQKISHFLAQNSKKWSTKKK